MQDKMNSTKYERNITHLKLAELEKKEKLKAVITQNIRRFIFSNITR